MEHEEAYNARGKGLSSGLLVTLIGNRQGAEDFMSRARMEELQQAAHLDPALVDYCQPAIEDFPQGGLPGTFQPGTHHASEFPRHSRAAENNLLQQP